MIAANRDLTCKEIAEGIDANPDSVNSALKRMPDVWRDRWDYPQGTGRPHAIWCIVTDGSRTPEDCPPPPKGSKRKQAA